MKLCIIILKHKGLLRIIFWLAFKMKVLHRYIITEFIPPTLLALFVFSFILTMERIFDSINLLISKGVSFSTVIQLLGYALPPILVYTIPLAILAGTLICFGRLSSDNEITAIQASGLSLYTIFLPVIIVSLIVSISLVSFNQQIAPRAYNQFRRLYYQIIHKNPVLKLEERTFLDIRDYRLYVEKIKHKKGKLSGIIMYEMKKEGFPTLITAQRGNMISNEQQVVFKLFDGTIQQKDEDDPNKYSITYFKNYDISLDLTQTPPPKAKRIRQMEKSELLQEIKRLKRDNVPTYSLEIEYHQRRSLAFAAFVFCLIGIPLGIRARQKGKSIGFGLSLLLFLLYWFLLMEGIRLGERGITPPQLGVWIPNLAIGITGAWMIYRTTK
ncbi:MAG: LPS export ABC transporter permease LptF [bacterium]